MVNLKMGILQRFFGEGQIILDTARLADRYSVVGSVTFKFSDISVPETTIKMGETFRKKLLKQLRPALHLLCKRGASENQADNSNGLSSVFRRYQGFRRK